MKPRRNQILVVLFAAGLGVALVAAAPQQNRPYPTEAEVDAYMKLGDDVGKTLSTSFKRLHPYVKADSWAEAQAKRADATFLPLGSHRDIVRQSLLTQDFVYRGSANYLISFHINPDALPKNRELFDSNNMLSTALLNYYLSPLEKLGYLAKSSPMVAVGGTQYSSNSWYPKRCWENVRADCPMWVEAEVFYAPLESSVLMRITVHTSFPAANK